MSEPLINDEDMIRITPRGVIMAILMEAFEHVSRHDLQVIAERIDKEACGLLRKRLAERLMHEMACHVEECDEDECDTARECARIVAGDTECRPTDTTLAPKR